jgi:hypothetical protein
LHFLSNTEAENVKHVPLRLWVKYHLEKGHKVIDYGSLSTSLHPVTERFLGVLNGELAISYNRELFIMKRLQKYLPEEQACRILDAASHEWNKYGLMIRTAHGGKAK